MLDTLERHIAEVIEGEPDPPRIQMPTASQAAPHRDHFKVDQRQRGELLATQPVPDDIAVRAIVQECDGQDAGVNDEHGQTATR